MNAGSSPDTGTDRHGFVIPITEPPIVEIDTEATAAYIRLLSDASLRRRHIARSTCRSTSDRNQGMKSTVWKKKTPANPLRKKEWRTDRKAL